MDRKLLPLIITMFLMAACSGRQRHMDNGMLGDEDTLALSEEPRQLTADEERDELIAQEPLPVAADELFDDFIFNFASNRVLQMERIKFPLLVNSGAKKEYLEKDQWKMEHFFMHLGEYTIMFDNERQMDLVKDTAVSEVAVEKIFLEDEFVRQYLFNRKSGRWMLEEIRNQTLPRKPMLRSSRSIISLSPTRCSSVSRWPMKSISKALIPTTTSRAWKVLLRPTSGMRLPQNCHSVCSTMWFMHRKTRLLHRKSSLCVVSQMVLNRSSPFNSMMADGCWSGL